MAEDVDAVRNLARIIQQVGASAVLQPELVARSTLYDSEYHVSVVACAFAKHAKPDAGGRRWVLAPWLKLLQFVAARPRLLNSVRTWAESRREANLDTWRMVPRGYVGDRTHDAVVDLLVAAGVLERIRDSLVEGPRIATLDTLYARVAAADLFTTERDVLAQLVAVRPNRTMLSGF